MIHFDEASHTYTYKGEEVPSVTTILKPLTDLSGIPPAVLERKRQIGTATHKAIELDIQGKLDYSTIHEAVQPYFDAWQTFRHDTGFQPELTEQIVHHEELGYAGTLDLFGDLGGDALIDVKTSLTIYPSVGPQTAAYLLASGRSGKRYALQLMKDGRYKLHPCTSISDLNVFLACLTVHNFQKGKLK